MLHLKAHAPTAVLFEAVLLFKAKVPTAVLSPFVVTQRKLCAPTAVLLSAVVFLAKANLTLHDLS